MSGPAAAHEGELPFRSEVTAVEPRVDGLEVEVQPSVAPVVTLRNGTGAPVIVAGEGGEPYLRITSSSVEINRFSPTAYRASDPFGRVPVPDEADASADPEWRRIGDGPSWRWFDPRVRPPAGAPAAPTATADDLLAAWDLPLRVGDREVTVRGEVRRLETHGHFITELDEVPGGDGLELRVLEGVIPALFVRNQTGQELAVPGLEGEPFLRIGAEGVFGNLRSPSYYLAGSQRVREVPDTADVTAPPEWERLSPTPIWAWLEYRARVPGREDPFSLDEQPFTLGETTETVLRWTTPATLGGEPAPIRGHVRWVPAAVADLPAEAEDRPWVTVAAWIVGSVVLLGGALWLRGRRSVEVDAEESA